MSSLWHEVAPNSWRAVPLADVPDLPVEGIRFLRFGRGSDRGVALLAPPEVPTWINGYPILGGLCVLEHKDEILLGGARLYFSAESIPTLALFRPRPGERPPTCPVCRGPLREGDQAVQCPGCSRWYHELNAVEGRPAKPCWTYAPTCRFCNHPTPFSGAAAWRPEMEDASA